MPEAFEKCRAEGGEIRTATGPSGRFKLRAGEYRHYCYKGGKTYFGEKKTKQKEKK